jgi:transcriptional regulator with XRE-family HTH domain
MVDRSWRNLESWERVKWARTQRFESASAAAAALGMKEGTYRCYERGPDSAKFMRLEYHHARRFAGEFKVRWEWLLEGAGEPWLTPPEEDDGEFEEEKPPNNLRAWREKRGLTVAELARKSGLGAQTIADLETGASDLSGKLIRTLASALDTTQGHLLDHDPDDVEPKYLDAMRAVPKDKRDQAIEILKTFRPYSKLR